MRFALPALCLTFAALAALIASQSQSHAYSSIKVFDNGEAGFGREVRWEMAATRTNQANGRILYRIGANGTADTLTGPFNEFAAIQKAFSVWASIDGLDLDFEFAGTTSNPTEDGNDDVNTIYWATGGFGPGELAVTTTTFDVTNGQILDADLAFNDDYVWDTYAENVTVGSAGRSAIRQTAVHEIGHFLGLDHSFLGRATLFPFTDAGAISGISLAHDDISGLYAAHADPSALTPNQNGSVSGTVTLSGTGRLGVQVTLIDIATGRPIVSALSDRATPVSTAGAYRIENVPAGNYWVVASPILTTDIGFYYSQAETLTDFSPTILGVAADMSGAPTILSVGQDEDLTGIDFALTAAAGFFEANDTVATASAIAVGDALGARIESTSDLDHYRFNAQQGETVTIRVHADGMGSDLNPFLVLYDTNGTSKLVSGDFNDSGESFYNAAARDRQANGFVLQVLDFDAEITFTAPATGDYTVMVDGTSFTTGFYFLTLTSGLTQAAVDSNATTLAADQRAVAASSDVIFTVTPRNVAGLALPTSTVRTVELFDVTGGGMVNIGMTNGPGPWTFTETMPAGLGLRRYQARVDGVMMAQVREVSVHGALDGTASIVEAVNASLPSDGEASTTIRVGLRDAAGHELGNTGQTVSFTTSAGQLRSSTTQGSTISGEYDAASGHWSVTLVAPTTGTNVMVSAAVGATNLGAVVLDLTTPATAPASTGGGGSSGGGGGCALVSTSGGHWLVLLALGLVVVMGRARPVRARG